MGQQQYSAIYTRLPNEDDGGYLKFPARLISKNVAFAIFDEKLEVHVVKPTTIPDEYDLIFASAPVFYVGSDATSVFEEIRMMPLVELARKYPLLCTGSLTHLLLQFFADMDDKPVESIGIWSPDDETLEQQAVTLEILQEVTDRVLGENKQQRKELRR